MAEQEWREEDEAQTAAEAEACHHQHGRVRHRTPEEREAVLKRLRRIEGQVRGIHRMVEEEAYCVDVLIQIAAARAALDQVGLILLEQHTRGCVARAVREGREEGAWEELMEVLRRFIR